MGYLYTFGSPSARLIGLQSLTCLSCGYYNYTIYYSNIHRDLNNFTKSFPWQGALDATFKWLVHCVVSETSIKSPGIFES